MGVEGGSVWPRLGLEVVAEIEAEIAAEVGAEIAAEVGAEGVPCGLRP